MSKQIEIDDFAELGVVIKDSLEKHGVDPEMHYSLISDILFNCAYLIDEKTGSDHHERIHGLIDLHEAKFIDDYEEDRFISWIRITLGVGKQHTIRLYESDFESKEEIKKKVELILNITRTKKSFEEITERRKGIKSIGFNEVEFNNDNNWVEIPFTKEDSGEYECSTTGISKLIRDELDEKYNKLQQ